MTGESPVTHRLANLAGRRAAMYSALAGQILEAPGSLSGLATSLEQLWLEVFGHVNSEVAEETVAWLRSHEGTDEVLAREHADLFRVRTGQYLAPFESVYRGASFDGTGWSLGCLRGPAWHEVRAAYRAAGFEPNDAEGVEADHLGCELSFLAKLCERENTAWADGDRTSALEWRRTTRRFLREHTAAWVTRLRQRLDDLSDSFYYRRLFVILEQYLSQETEYLGRDHGT